MNSILCMLLSLATVVSTLAAVPTPLHKLRRDELAARLQSDARSVEIHRRGMARVLEFVRAHPELFPSERVSNGVLPNREQREQIWAAWRMFLDYQLALESIRHQHASFYRLSGKDARGESFAIGRAALLAQYRHALDFIARAENNPEQHRILNDPVPELGLPADSYARLKFRFLNAGIASEFAASEVLAKTMSAGRFTTLAETTREDAGVIWRAGKGKGHVLTAKNALKVLQDSGLAAWFPIQAGVSEWMGDTKVFRPGRSLISDKQIEALGARLLPGDVLLERREWYLSNIGLPGYWPHAALYVGTPAERKEFFTEAAVRQWVVAQGEVSGDFEALLARRYPAAYSAHLQPQEHGHVPRVVEAISEGVSMTTLEHSAACDSLAVLRPRLSKPERALAILRAFHYQGRPYDFDFDFATDSELVCSELVFKAYEPSAGMKGLNLPLIEMLGRKLMPANEVVRQFDAQWETPAQQFDLVTFLDGHESKGAVERDATAFRASCRRPKWHILTQDLPAR